jgi:hypothetical protein
MCFVETLKLLYQSYVTVRDLDPIPSSFVKQCAPVLVPKTTASIVNLSLSSGVFLNSLKTVQFIRFLINLKNQIVIKKILVTIVLSHSCLFV